MEQKHFKIAMAVGIGLIVFIVGAYFARIIWAPEGVHHAAGHNQLRNLNIILTLRPGQVNSKNENGRTPLHLAAWQGSIEAMDILIGKGADLSIRDQTGKNALHLAVYNEQRKAANMLLDKGIEPDMLDGDGKTALHWAIEKRCADMVEMLVENNAGINIANPMGERPLDMAIIIGDKDIAWILMLHGARTYEEEGPLHIAANRGKDALEYLFMQNDFSDMNDRDRNNNTPLHMATSDAGATELLIKHGAEPNVQNRNGDTPLHLAAAQGQQEVAQLLLEAGAQSNIRNSEKKTPLSIARNNRNYLLIDIFTKHGVELGRNRTVLHLAVEDMSINAIENLVESGFDVNTKDSGGATPLHYAARSSELAAAVLLELGADLNLKNNQGRTPLHTAAYRNNFDTAKTLLVAGASVNITDRNGKTPLDLANDDRIIELLKKETHE